VTIKYRAVDAAGKEFISGTAQVTDYLCDRTGPTIYKWCPLGYKNSNLMETTLSDVGLPAGGRRLEDRLRQPADDHWHPPQVKEEDLLEPEDEDEKEEPDDEEEDSSSRKLLSGRSLGSQRSLKKSSKSKSSRPSPPPAKSTKSSSSSSSPPKHVESGARRRAGAPAPAGDRRRISQPDGSSYKNPNSKSGAGSYGYGSKAKIDKGFKGGHTKTKYGYSGPKAYKGSKGGISTGMMVGAAAGGLVLGAGAMYMYSNSNSRYSQWGRSGYGWRQVECSYDSDRDGCWKDTGFIDILTSTGECNSNQRAGDPSYNGRAVFPPTGIFSSSDRSCYKCNKQQYWTRCQRKAMNYDLNRDDVMATGFIPNDMASPIKITVYSVIGADFNMPSPVAGQFTPRDDVCPPQNWNAANDTPVWEMASPAKDIYVTLTPLDEFANTNVNVAPVHGLSMILGLCILALLKLR